MPALFVVLCGCVKNAVAPITSKSNARQEIVTVHRAGRITEQFAPLRPRSYKVQSGDTLYSIAWRFGLDFRSVKRWNRLSNPHMIKAGQALRLYAPPAQLSRPVDALKIDRPTNKLSSKKQLSTPRLASQPIKWFWPASGPIKAASSVSGAKGIEISGERGAPIKSAADGLVVYSGSGLRGYGALIIVKHDEDFLSAYAHNDKLLVAEGVTVESGQQIATMGDSDAKRVMLHFEIRRNGKAVEPLNYLPQR
ncbi:MAG TPA: peptidase M23 [Gammaproteobacteria bacterium]|nr:peptidase M23 [Gammaproteobacteria bacterium]